MKTNTLATKTLAAFALFAFAVSSFGFQSVNVARAASDWNMTGSYVFDMNYDSTNDSVDNGTDYPHNVTLVQNGSDQLSGSGTSGAYAWTITSGLVTNDSFEFHAHYMATPDAVTPQTVLHVMGDIASDGSLSGTWSDNYNGGARSGTWVSTTGTAVPLAGSLTSQDFGVWDASGIKGYSAGWSLTDATFTDAQSIVVKLYSGATLLQTDTAINPTTAFTGLTQISSPFDVFGTFNYPVDGYWTNVRQAEYGQTLTPDKVVATVTLANGKIVTAQNTTLTGDPSTIMPAPGNVATNGATAITTSGATLNGTNGATAASGTSFWASTSPYSTAGTMPAGVYSTSDLGAVAANTAFSTPLSSVTGLPAITPNTTYYFNAWSNGGGTWLPGAVMSFTTSNTVVDPDPETSTVTIVKYVDAAPATGTSADNTDFPINATWNASNLGGAGSGQFALSENGFSGGPAYQAVTSEMTNGSSYSINEAMDANTGALCSENKPYSLMGYSTGDSLSAAQAATPSMTAPNLTNITSDKFIIVWNDDCSTPAGGTIGGNVGSGEGVLAVTSIETLDDSAVANGNFEDGWKYAFNITVPTNETDVAMKFSNWVQTGNASEIIPAANNIRISSAQAVNESTILITAADTYSTPDLQINEDLNPTLAGLQIRVLVEVRVPSGTDNGSYTTNYGVRSN